MRYVVPKGSIAVDGVSLTVVEVSGEEFTVALIPHTQEATLLCQEAPGGPVNLEADVLAKYVERAVIVRDEGGIGGVRGSPRIGGPSTRPRGGRERGRACHWRPSRRRSRTSGGKFVIIVDDEAAGERGRPGHRRGEGDARGDQLHGPHGPGPDLPPLTGQRLDELHIPMMVRENTGSFGTAFTVSVEARRGVTTGSRRATAPTTVQAAIDPASPGDLARPGHLFPLRAREGCLKRAGQTEASVDLARLAEMYPAP